MVLKLVQYRKDIKTEQIESKNVQDIINFTEILDEDPKKNPQNEVINLNKKGYSETPQISGMEEDLKVDAKNNILEKLSKDVQLPNSSQIDHDIKSKLDLDQDEVFQVNN